MLFIGSSAILSIHLRGIQWSQRNCRNPFTFNAYYHNFTKLIFIKWCPQWWSLCWIEWISENQLLYNDIL